VSWAALDLSKAHSGRVEDWRLSAAELGSAAGSDHLARYCWFAGRALSLAPPPELRAERCCWPHRRVPTGHCPTSASDASGSVRSARQPAENCGQGWFASGCRACEGAI